MAKTTARTWALFKVIRAMVYTLTIITCLGLGIIYGILIAYGWDAYQLYQRAIVVLLLTIYTISSVTFYFMLILRFRLILDGIRLGLLFILQVGGTVTFAFITDSLPCVRIARQMCKLMENVAVLGGYSLAGLILIFSFYLIGMHYVPVPTRRMHPEALLALQLSQNQKTAQLDEKGGSKRPLSVRSAGSDRSIYSQKSYRSPYTYAAPPGGMMDKNHSPSSSEGSVNNPTMPMDVMRSQTPGSHYRPITPGSMHTGEISSAYPSRTQIRQVVPPFEHYRSPTPTGSVRSVALTSSSSIRTVPRQRYIYNNGIPAPQARMPPTASYPMLVTPLTHAFSEPVSRHGTPMTALSNSSFYMPPTPTRTQSEQRRQQRALLSPPGLATVGEGMSFPQPPATVYSRSGSPNTSPKYNTATLPAPGLYEYSEDARRFRLRQSPSPTPVGVQLQDAPRTRIPSPRAGQSPPLKSEEERFHSRTPMRAPSISSIPRSPSLENISFTESLPSTPRAGILPARPDMNAAAYNGRFGAMSPQMSGTHRERYGSDASTDSMSMSVRSGHSGLTNERPRFGSYPDIAVNGTPVPRTNAQYYHQAQASSEISGRAGGDTGAVANDGYRKPLVVRNDWIAQDPSGEIEIWRKDMERRYNRTPVGAL